MGTYARHVYPQARTCVACVVGVGAYMYAHGVRMWVRIAYCASARYVCGHALCTPTREETATTPYTESVEGYFATGLT